MLFTGHAEATIDAKGRLGIPSKFRSKVDPGQEGPEWVCVPWPGGVLRVYTAKRFEELASRGASSLTPDQDLAELQSTLYGMAESVEPDGAGRISLPKHLVELVKVGSEVVVVGAGDRLEVHDRATWQQSLEKRFSNLPSLVARLGSRKD